MIRRGLRHCGLQLETPRSQSYAAPALRAARRELAPAVCDGFVPHCLRVKVFLASICEQRQSYKVHKRCARHASRSLRVKDMHALLPAVQRETAEARRPSAASDGARRARSRGPSAPSDVPRAREVNVTIVPVLMFKSTRTYTHTHPQAPPPRARPLPPRHAGRRTRPRCNSGALSATSTGSIRMLQTV